jgi:pyridoxal phosphate enzyme (YggS family)
MTAASHTDLAERLAAVRANIAAACARVNRSVESVTLIAVSKTHPAESVLAAVAAGQLQFGENRVEEAESKIQAVRAQTSAPIVWHMIGHVQSRKAEDVVKVFEWVHSVDTVKVANIYSRKLMQIGKSTQLDRSMSVLLEINISGEPSKSGFQAAQWQNARWQRESLWNDIRTIIKLPGIHVEGLMTVAPIVEDMEQARSVFIGLRDLRDALAADFPDAAWTSLSMGMTDDYPVAIEEGATLVRIGRAIFGPRG